MHVTHTVYLSVLLMVWHVHSGLEDQESLL